MLTFADQESASGWTVHQEGKSPCAGANAGGFAFRYCFSDTVTLSGNADAHFQGELLDPAPAPDRAVRLKGFLCLTPVSVARGDPSTIQQQTGPAIEAGPVL